jgi:peptide-methionine (S)-S-oxide reductase
MSLFSRKTDSADTRETEIEQAVPMGHHGTHSVLGRAIDPPFPDGYERAVVGMGCFWGADRSY